MDGGLFEVYFTSLIVEMASQQVAVYVCVARLDICSMPHWAHAIVAWDLWLGPRTGPAGASTVSGKSAA